MKDLISIVRLSYNCFLFVTMLSPASSTNVEVSVGNSQQTNCLQQSCKAIGSFYNRLSEKCRTAMHYIFANYGDENVMAVICNEQDKNNPGKFLANEWLYLFVNTFSEKDTQKMQQYLSNVPDADESKIVANKIKIVTASTLLCNDVISSNTYKSNIENSCVLIAPKPNGDTTKICKLLRKLDKIVKNSRL